MTTPTVRTFSLQFCSLQLSSLNLTGFAEGEAFKLVYAADDFEVVVSSDGQVIAVQK